MSKILIVDDEPDIVNMLQILLKSEGYETMTAFDGQDGLDKARTEKPDMIVLDLMLPKLDGYRVCRMLKFDEKYKQIPIIIVTARAQEKDIKLGKEVGADRYLTKPFDPMVLISLIKDLQK